MLHLDYDGRIVGELSRVAVLHRGVDHEPAAAGATEHHVVPDDTLDTIEKHLEGVEPARIREHVPDGTAAISRHELLP